MPLDLTYEQRHLIIKTVLNDVLNLIDSLGFMTDELEHLEFHEESKDGFQLESAEEAVQNLEVLVKDLYKQLKD